jgi:hypothetical protein
MATELPGRSFTIIDSTSVTHLEEPLEAVSVNPTDRLWNRP